MIVGQKATCFRAASSRIYLLYNLKPFDSMMHFPSRVRLSGGRSKKTAYQFHNTQDMMTVDPKEIKASLSLFRCSYPAVVPILGRLHF